MVKIGKKRYGDSLIETKDLPKFVSDLPTSIQFLKDIKRFNSGESLDEIRPNCDANLSLKNGNDLGSICYKENLSSSVFESTDKIQSSTLSDSNYFQSFYLSSNGWTSSSSN